MLSISKRLTLNPEQIQIPNLFGQLHCLIPTSLPNSHIGPHDNGNPGIQSLHWRYLIIIDIAKLDET